MIMRFLVFLTFYLTYINKIELKIAQKKMEKKKLEKDCICDV